MTASIIPIVGIPQFELTIGNSAVTPELKAAITSLEVKEDLDMPAMLSFSLNLWDNTSQTLKEEYFDQFALGTPIELAMGINETESLFTGEVTALEPEFGGLDGGDSLKVQAYNRLYRLQFGTHQKTFEEMSSSEIASAIASDVGLTGEVEDSVTKHKHITQNNLSNLRFLLELAKPLNFEVKVEEKKLFFTKTQESESHALSLTYRRDLVEFSPRQRAIPDGAKVEVRGWDAKNKQAIVGKAQSGDEETKMGGQQSGAEISSSAFESVTQTITSQPVADIDEANQIAKARYNKQQANFIEADGESAGSALIRAGKTIEILGVGEAFSGIYYVTSATHSINGDVYKTNFKARRNAI